MARQQEIRYPLFDGVLVPAVAADHFAGDDLRFEEEGVELGEEFLLF